jgi:osmoprotectant transport system permease protein
VVSQTAPLPARTADAQPDALPRNNERAVPRLPHIAAHITARITAHITAYITAHITAHITARITDMAPHGEAHQGERHSLLTLSGNTDPDPRADPRAHNIDEATAPYSGAARFDTRTDTSATKHLDSDATHPSRAAARSGIIFGIIALLANASLLAAIVLSERAARQYDQALGHLTRVSLGYSFWLLVLAVYVVLNQSVSAIRSRVVRGLFVYAVPLAVIALIATHRIEYISLMKEYENVRDIFVQEFRRHVFLSAGSVAVATVLGVLSGILAVRKPSFERPLFSVLNAAQVIPTLSFVGLLMVPLGYIGEHVALAQALNIRGVGWAPVFIVLVFYALYPITRNTVAALRSLNRDFLETAVGLGYDPIKLFFDIELPLALPVIFAGIRVALVQASAGTIIAALVGGGGLGVFVFLGLAQTAQDLALLGVVPIVALAFAYNALALAVERALSPYARAPESSLANMKGMA